MVPWGKLYPTLDELAVHVAVCRLQAESTACCMSFPAQWTQCKGDSCVVFAQLLMNIPFTALYFASYESAKQALISHASGEESLLIQVWPLQSSLGCFDPKRRPPCSQVLVARQPLSPAT